eukprot:3920709-Amphidinium_carterae.1
MVQHESGALWTLRPQFVKGSQAVFMWKFFQLQRFARGTGDLQRLLIKFQTLREKKEETWMEIRPFPGPFVAGGADHNAVAAVNAPLADESVDHGAARVALIQTQTRFGEKANKLRIELGPLAPRTSLVCLFLGLLPLKAN